MKPEDIFQDLPPEQVRQVASFLAFDPEIDGKFYSCLSESDQLSWLQTNRDALTDHFCWVGSPLFGKRRGYDEIVSDAARKVGAKFLPNSSTIDIERAIVGHVWENARGKMTEAQRTELNARIKEIADKHGKHFGKEFSGLAALSAAQLSGFGVYILGSTLLGAINSALGLGLGFGVFTGLSSLISVLIGPAGWALLGLATVAKLGGPNYKKIIPAIIVVATYRAGQQARPAPTSPSDSPASRPSSLAVEFVVADAANISGSQVAVPEVPAIEKTIETVTQEATRIIRRPAVARAPREYSRQEKTIFCLQNRELCETAQFLIGKHFLDLTDEDQQTVGQLVKERNEFFASEEREHRKQARKDRKQQQKQARLRRRRSSGDNNIEIERKKLKHAFPSLTFRDTALERYLSLQQHHQVLAYEQFGQLNRGNTDGKHQVPETKPKLFQRDAGSDLRIYYQRESSELLLIHLIGTKADQDSDYKILQGR